MKIALVVGSLAVSCGGPALETITLANDLSARYGHETVIVTWKSEGAQLDRQGVEVFELDPLNRPAGWVATLRELTEIFGRQDAVIVTGIWSPSDGLAVRLSWPKHIPVYIKVCGMLEPYILSRHPLRKFIGRHAYVNWNLRQAAGIVASSQPEASRIAALGFGKNVRVIRNAVPMKVNEMNRAVARRRHGIAPETRTLLYLGRIHPKKGLHFLLEAYREWSQSHRADLRIIVAGPWSDPVYEQQIKQLAETPELRQVVSLIGEVAGEAKDAAFAAADFFILPSESEGLPNAVLEALAQGIPCIVTPGCNMPEIPQYQAGISVAASIPGQRSALEWAMADGLNLNVLQENARRLSREVYDLSVSTTAYHHLVAGGNSVLVAAGS